MCAEARDVAQRQIDLLREYRTRLIADFVPGKLEVRAAAATLPEEPDDAVAVEADCVNAEGKTTIALTVTRGQKYRPHKGR